MLQIKYPWTKPFGPSDRGYTCGWCNGEITEAGVFVLVNTSTPDKPLYEARHQNGECDVRRYLIARDGEGRVVYLYSVAEVKFTWRPGTSQIRVNGFGPEGDLNISVYDHATGKTELPNETRPFALKCEEWYADMNTKSCVHCDRDIHPNFKGEWLDDDDNKDCAEVDDAHRPGRF